MKIFQKIALTALFVSFFTIGHNQDVKAAHTFNDADHAGCNVRGTYRYTCGEKNNCEIKLYKNNMPSGEDVRTTKSARECIAYANHALTRFRGCTISGLQGISIPCSAASSN